MRSKWKHRVAGVCALMTVLTYTATTTLLPVQAIFVQERAAQVMTTASAEDLTYRILEDGTAEITGYTGSDSAIVIPSEIDGVTVTSIGTAAFRYNEIITSVEIPGTVTILKDSAFRQCPNLTTVNIPDSVTTIELDVFRKSGLTSIDMPDSVTELGIGAIAYCLNLTSAKLSNSLTTIPEYTLEGCTALTELSMPQDITEIGRMAFRYIPFKSFTIPETVTYIGDETFTEMGELTVLNPEMQFEVDAVACEKLIGFNGSTADEYANEYGIPFMALDRGETPAEYFTWHMMDDGTVEIDGYVGKETDIVIPAVVYDMTVTSIGAGAFRENEVITSVVIPDTVTILKDSAFRLCPNLKSVTIPDSVTTIELDVFRKSGLTSIDMPDSVTELGIGAIAYCLDLTSAKLSNSLTTIPDYTLEGCTALKELSMPQDITRIGKMAFRYIPFERFMIPETVTYIGNESFTGMGELIVLNPEMQFEKGAVACDKLVGYSGSTAEEYAVGNKLAFERPEGDRGITADGIEWQKDNTFGEGVAIRGYMGTSTTVTIPDEINGLKVTGIGAEVFKGSAITTITMPALYRIGTSAFEDCKSLKEITFQSKRMQIDENAFSSCTSLSLVNYDGGTFADWKTSMMDNSMIASGNDALLGCRFVDQDDVEFDPLSGEAVVTETTTTTAATTTTTASTTTTTTETTESTEEVDPSITSGVTADGFVWKVDENLNKAVCIMGYEGDETDIVIPERINGYDVLGLAAGAFKGSQITSINLSQIMKIRHNAFEDCKALKEVTFENRYIEIDYAAFRNCPNITTGYYMGGTVDNWKSTVRNHLHPGNDCLLDKTFYDMDEQPFNASKRQFDNSIPNPAIVDAGPCGDDLMYYHYANGDLYIVGSGDMYDYEQITDEETFTVTSTSPLSGLSYSVNHLYIDDRCTSIGAYAFYDTRVDELIIPDNVTSIGKCAFEDSYCDAIYIPESVSYIGESAFYWVRSYMAYGEFYYPVFIMNPDCEFENHPGIDSTMTIIGYTGSTAEALALKYNRPFEAIDAPDTDPNPDVPAETTAPATETTTAATTTTTVTTTVAETTSTTEAATTTTVAESTTTAKETTATTEATTETAEYFASIDEMCDMAVKDYEQKTGTAPAKAEAVTNEDGSVSIVLTDESGETLDTYVIDPVTGVGTSGDGAEVNLPQTGNNSLGTAATAAAALTLAVTGAFAVLRSGVIGRKKEEE